MNKQFNEENFTRITSLENLAKHLSKNNSPFVEYEEKELILKKLMCDYDSVALQDPRTVQGVQNLRNTVVKYLSICIKKERENAEVDWNNIDKYEMARSKITAVLDEMIINKRRA